MKGLKKAMNLSRSKSNENGNNSNRSNNSAASNSASQPKGSAAPSNSNYQGSIKSLTSNASSPSSSNASLPRDGGSGSGESSSAFGRAGGASTSSYGAGGGTGSTPERRSGSNLADKTSPAPPVVVVSSEMPADPIPHIPHHLTGSPSSPPPLGAHVPSLNGLSSEGGAHQPPKAGSLNRLRQGVPVGVKDTIPITSKTPPRKQRSSRFHVTERVEIEKLPNFGGKLILQKCLLKACC